MNDLLDEVQGSGTFDLISAVAEPLPVAVIAELLGIPEDDRRNLRPWSAGIAVCTSSTRLGRRGHAVRACEAFSDELRTLSRERRMHPTGDLISERPGRARAAGSGVRPHTGEDPGLVPRVLR